MKLEWNGRTVSGRYSLTAIPTDYDGAPEIDTLYLDWSPLTLHDDLLAVASILSFSTYFSGQIVLPRRVSPEVAQGIQEFLAPTWTSISPIEFEPRANPIAEGNLLVTTEFTDWGRVPSQLGKPRTSSLIVRKASEFAGVISSSHGAIVSSNAEEMGCVNRGCGAFPLIAVALIYAETYHASNLILAPSVHELMTEVQMSAVRKLLQTCKVGLSMISD